MTTDIRLEDIMSEYRFLQILQTDWKDMPAYKNGIISETGKILKSITSLKETKERQAYPDIFYALCWNTKRLLEQAIKSNDNLDLFIRSVWSLKNKYGGLTPNKYEIALKSHIEQKGISLSSLQGMFIKENKKIVQGKYTLNGKHYVIRGTPKPIGEVFGISLYRAGKTIFTINELKKMIEDGEGGGAAAPANNVGGGAMAGVSPGQEPPKPKKKSKKVLKRNQIQRDAKTINIVVPSALKGK